MGKHQCTACKRTFRTAQGLGLHFNHARKNPKVCDGQPRIDPRDAEIARLKAEVGSKNATIEATRRHIDRLRRALAAGPAALRECAPSLWSGEAAAREIERAQADTMKEEP